MTFDQLKIFVAVAEREHVTRAAEALNLTQSAVSAAIGALERRYQVSLFDRIGRRIALTQAGRLFLGEAKAILARAAAAELALSDLNGLGLGHISIKASQTIVSYWLPALLVRFRAAYPGITFQVAMGNTALVKQAVLSSDADVGFVEGEVEGKDLWVQEIASDPLLIVVCPSHPWASAKRLSKADLTQTDWVLREPGSGVRSAFEASVAATGVDPRSLRVAYELPSNEAVRTAVEAGGGATALSRMVTERALAAGRLKAVKFDLLPRRFSVVLHSGRQSSRALQAMLDMAGTRQRV